MDGGSVGQGAEISIREIVASVWRAKWVVLAITVTCAIAGGMIGKYRQKEYRAEILVSPSSDSPTGSGSLGGLASQYSGLAAMAGLSMSGRDSSFKDETIAVLQSQLITESYIRANDLLPVLFPKSWDEHAKQWRSTDPKKIPTLWMGAQSFKRIRDVKMDKATGLLTMRITWIDPVVAAKWANDLVKVTNKYLRDKAIGESARNIQYLAQQAAETTVVEARNAIYSILKDEVNKQMIARGREEYALKVLDPAEVPERPSSPSAQLLAIVGALLGIALSGLYILTRGAIDGSRPLH